MHTITTVTSTNLSILEMSTILETAASVVVPVQKVTKAKAKASTTTPAVLPIVASSTPSKIVVDASFDGKVIGDAPTEAVTFTSVFTKIAAGLAKFKEVAMDLKILQKDTARIAKESIRRPRRVVDPLAEPSGFRKPVGLSPEMALFVGVDLDAKVSRNNVTKAVTTYIKTHDLQDTPDKRVILPDETLRALLGITDQKLTYFNLQSYLKKHFLKTDSASVTTPVA